MSNPQLCSTLPEDKYLVNLLPNPRTSPFVLSLFTLALLNMSHNKQEDTAAQTDPTPTANALHTTQRELASESTPAKKKYGPDLAYTSAVKTFEEVRSHLGREMNGRWLGAMPVDAFLDKYVPAAKEPLPDLSKKPFEKVPTKGVETSRYDPFVSTRLIPETSVS